MYMYSARAAGDVIQSCSLGCVFTAPSRRLQLGRNGVPRHLGNLRKPCQRQYYAPGEWVVDTHPVIFVLRFR